MTPPERVITTLHVDSEMGFSGGEVQVFLLLEGLRREGHEVLLVCQPGSASQEHARELGIPVETVAMRNDLDLPGGLGLRRIIARSGAELVHLHTGRASWLGSLALRPGGPPAVVTRRQERPVRPGWRTRRMYGGAVRRVVAISESVRDCLVGGGVPADRIRVISSAVDPERLRPGRGREAFRAAMEVEEGVPVVLCLGSLVRRKGIDVLLEALALLAADGRARLPRVWIVGQGPERPALEARSAELGLGASVRFLGRRAEVGDLFAACDLVCMPSRAEGLGVAALEAMAAGRAVLASRTGGLAEAVVDGRTGVLVSPDDPAALAEGLGALLADPARAARLGGEGPARVAEGYLGEQMCGAYLALYREILGEAAS